MNSHAHDISTLIPEITLSALGDLGIDIDLSSARIEEHPEGGFQFYCLSIPLTFEQAMELDSRGFPEDHLCLPSVCYGNQWGCTRWHVAEQSLLVSHMFDQKEDPDFGEEVQPDDEGGTLEVFWTVDSAPEKTARAIFCSLIHHQVRAAALDSVRALASHALPEYLPLVGIDDFMQAVSEGVLERRELNSMPDSHHWSGDALNDPSYPTLSFRGA